MTQKSIGTALEKLRLYESRSFFYLIGRDKHSTLHRLVKIDRFQRLEHLSLVEDPTTYSEQEISALLDDLNLGNKSSGGLTLRAEAVAVLGFVRFHEGYYLSLVTKSRRVGCIAGHDIYTIMDTTLIAIPHNDVRATARRDKGSFDSLVPPEDDLEATSDSGPSNAGSSARWQSFKQHWGNVTGTSEEARCRTLFGSVDLNKVRSTTLEVKQPWIALSLFVVCFVCAGFLLQPYI